ncbi:FG-GAP-like repeat-containing protein [Bradyrhizobium liaoningense]|uniref:FG-GAP-like repeat-containing protein n=1 Tax=Bradyrhizobium liaoningense TaxID=43992 RepID=UPI001BAE0B14|nr:FG-GAP-like repeat-containing protein [Bradyrhizobium liaoningense]MBR0856676.1 VCBS repeat-containing protein [Bradyrhizobium liaoningense]
MATAVTVTRTNNADIDGLLSGYKWSGAITYSFPDSPSDYAYPYTGGSGEPTTSGFASAPTQMQAAINYAIGLILAYTSANIQYAGTNGADIMIAQSPAANPTSYAYYPGNYAAGGDIWFGTQYNYSLAKLGNYYFTTALHELGHALGLKHSQETGGPANVAVPSAHDDSEYTVMSYRSYVGASTTSGYTNEAYGYPQTYMANDILALQTMYGANYTTQSGATVYTWSPTTGQECINGVAQPADGGGVGGSANRIYETVWDGGGVDTYDLSNYTTNLSIDLNPGASSVFSSVQLANLGNGHYASGNVYNAYLYNGDARSYIDNATGGSGNDTVIGNAIANVLKGGLGDDTITGGGGNDTIIGGAGTDMAMYSGSRADYAVSYDASSQIFTIIDLRAGSPDGTDTVTGVENFKFADAPTNTSVSVTVVPQGGQMGPEWHIASVADYSGDGTSDLLWAKDSTGDAALWTMKNGSLSTYGLTQGHMGPEWTARSDAADFNHDGKADILWTNDSRGNAAIWEMNGPSLVGFGIPSGHMGDGWQVRGTGDFNGDGYSDILWVNSENQAAIWSMNGTTLAGFGISGGHMGSEWSVGAIGHFDGDSYADILWVSTAGDVAVWSMNGSNLSSLSTLGHISGAWDVAGVGDFNHDGTDDLIWVDASNNVEIWEIKDHRLSTILDPTGHMGTEWQLAGAGDVTGDGRADLVWQRSDGTTFVWKLDGATSAPSSASTSAAALAMNVGLAQASLAEAPSLLDSYLIYQLHAELLA